MQTETKRRLAFYPVVALVLCALVYGGFIYEAEADAGTLVNSAEVLAQIGKFDEAIARGEQALAQEPDHVYAHIIVAYAYGQKGDYQKSEAHYRRAVEASNPSLENYSVLRLYHAEILVKVGKADEAEKVVTDILREDPEQYQALFVLANAHKARDRLDDAADAYREAYEMAPDDPRPLSFLAQIEEDRGRFEEALALVEESRELFPENVQSSLYFARLLERTGARERAIEELVAAADVKLVAVRRAIQSDEFLGNLATDERIAALME